VAKKPVNKPKIALEKDLWFTHPFIINNITKKTKNHFPEKQELAEFFSTAQDACRSEVSWVGSFLFEL
jgi:hypothetical protein